ncbi:hypothetical protein GCM10027061_06870 [Nesterenkonia suensis]
MVDGALDGGLVERHEGEFDGDEEAGAEDQQESDAQEDPFHGVSCTSATPQGDTPVPRGGRGCEVMPQGGGSVPGSGRTGPAGDQEQ